jgi:hypothetical protein
MLDVKPWSLVPVDRERSSELAESIRLAILEVARRNRLSTRDVFGAVPLAIARFVSTTAHATDRSHQIAAAEAIFRHLGRGLLSLSYDRAMIAEMFEPADAPGPHDDFVSR